MRGCLAELLHEPATAQPIRLPTLVPGSRRLPVCEAGCGHCPRFARLTHARGCSACCLQAAVPRRRRVAAGQPPLPLLKAPAAAGCHPSSPRLVLESETSLERLYAVATAQTMALWALCTLYQMRTDTQHKPARQVYCCRISDLKSVQVHSSPPPNIFSSVETAPSCSSAPKTGPTHEQQHGTAAIPLQENSPVLSVVVSHYPHTTTTYSSSGDRLLPAAACCRHSRPPDELPHQRRMQRQQLHRPNGSWE